MSESQAVVTFTPGQVLLDRVKEKILAALPERMGKDRFFQIAWSVLKVPAIQKCTPGSQVTCIFACAKLGLMPDANLGHVYIIPRGMKINDQWVQVATVMPGYRGLIELARRSGAITAVNTEIVRQGDQFKYWIDEDGKHLRHIPDLEAEKEAEAIYVYCIAQLRDGTRQIEVMRWSAVLEIRDNNAPRNQRKQIVGPWVDHEDDMGRKTVARKGSKYWPLSSEFGMAVRWDEQAERGELQSLPQLDSEAERPRLRTLHAPEEPTKKPDGEPTDEEKAAIVAAEKAESHDEKE